MKKVKIQLDIKAEELKKKLNLKDGENGLNGVDGKDGLNGKDGKDGKDGSPDTGELIIEKINELPTDDESLKIDAKHIKGLPEPKLVAGVGKHNLYQLNDVNINTPTSGQVLKYNSTTRLWENNTDLNPVTSVSNSDGTLTISPTTGAVVASLNLAHSNTWTGEQSFNTSPLWMMKDQDYTLSDFDVWKIGLNGSDYLRWTWYAFGAGGQGALKFEDTLGNLRYLNANLYADNINVSNQLNGGNINGFIYPTGFSQHNVAFGAAGGYITGDAKFTFNTSTNRMLIANSGITAQSQLHLHQSGATALETRFTNSNTGSTATDGFQIGITSTGIAEIRQRESLGLNIYTANTQVIGITSGGLTAFGTQTATNKIHVDAGNATASYLQFTAGATTGQTSTDGFHVGINSSGTGEIRQYETLGLDFYTANTVRMSITSGGLVGIGTTATSLTHIVGSQPASVGTSPGTAATTVLTVTGGTGGDTTIATTGVGGIGAPVSITAGTGGRANSATTSATGGAGGSITLTSGVGGAVSLSSSNPKIGGDGGDISITGSAGGQVSGAGTGTNTGGRGADISIIGGTGGAAFSGGGTNSAGTGGNVTIRAGTCGFASSGGTSGTLFLYGGTANNPGSTPGDIYLFGGLAATGGSGSNGGGFNMQGADAGGNNTASRSGGSFNMEAGDSKGDATGGGMTLLGGRGGAGTGTLGVTGGAITLTPGPGGIGSLTGGTGGNLVLNAGLGGDSGTDGAGGVITFNVGATVTRSEAGRVSNAGNFGLGTGSTVSAKLHIISTTEQQRTGYDSSNYFSTTVSSTGGVTFNAVGSGSAFTFSDAVTINGSLTLSAQNIVTDTTTGMKIGTGTTQKLGFFNATPIVQQTTTSQTPSTFVANTSGIVDDTATWDGYTIGDIVKILRAFGLIA